MVKLATVLRHPCSPTHHIETEVTMSAERYHLSFISPGISLKFLTLMKWRDEMGEVQTFRLVNRVSCKWEIFGCLLNIPQNMLTAWREEFLNNSARCWLKVMDYWLTGEDISDYPVTWDGLYELLEDVEYYEEAKKLKEAVLAAKVKR